MADGILKSARSWGEVVSHMALKTVHVRAVRGFVHEGKLVQPGEVKQVPLSLGRELVAASQAERFDPNDPANVPASQQLQTRADNSSSASPQPAAQPQASESPSETESKPAQSRRR